MGFDGTDGAGGVGFWPGVEATGRAEVADGTIHGLTTEDAVAGIEEIKE